MGASNSKQAHLPVMPDEVMQAWLTDRAGVYVDGTFGRGGHSNLLLEQLEGQGRLHVFDRDREAIATAEKLASSWPQMQVHHAPFSAMALRLEACGDAGRVNGILLDLGVSSPQLDDPSRGFGFKDNGPLDMRMNTQI